MIETGYRKVDQKVFIAERKNPCFHPNHNPPNVRVSSDEEYVHQCPKCKEVTIVRPSMRMGW
jgi:hypothetical protein